MVQRTHDSAAYRRLLDKLHFLELLAPNDLCAIETLADEAIARHEREREEDLRRQSKQVTQN